LRDVHRPTNPRRTLKSVLLRLVNALGVLFNPESANNCKEMKIKDWDAALYEFDELSYLCWTDTPEVSYVLEYNPDVIPDEEILKMAESAETPEEKQ